MCSYPQQPKKPVCRAHNQQQVTDIYKYVTSSPGGTLRKANMAGDKLETAKNIGVSVAGSMGGNKVADALHLGTAGHIAGGVAGSMAANDAEQKAENKAGK